jgi:hypothetical protein
MMTHKATTIFADGEEFSLAHSDASGHETGHRSPMHQPKPCQAFSFMMINFFS